MKFDYNSLKSPNGAYIRKSSVKNNFPEGYQKVLDYSKTYELTNLSFSQQLWIYFHNTKGVPSCKCCEKKVNFESYNYGYKTYCSKKCAANDKELQEKKRKTNLEKYGSEYVGSSEVVRDKIKKTMIKKYGVENPMDVPKFVNKIKQTTFKKYGVENIMHLDEYKKKSMDTHIKNHNGFILNKKEVREKRNSIMYERFRKKFSHKNIISNDNGILKIKCSKCNIIYETYFSLLRNRDSLKIETCTICNPINNSSYAEKEIHHFLNGLPLEYFINDRSIIKPKELDVVIPSKKLAIEYNGLLWHSDKYIDKNYHLNKTIKANKAGYNLMHIFEDEWINKREIVKSIIKSKLGLIKKKYYARKCEIKTITVKEAKPFLENNHIQGYTNSKYKYGLYSNGELVAVMTFGNLRKSLGYSKNEGCYELLRYCSKINTVVVGGASKLFKYFIRSINPIKVISYANRRYFEGNMYQNMGMIHEGTTVPNYYYYDGVNLERQQRFKFRKDVLVSQGHDKDMTEKEIMYYLGYHRIYDCGNYKFGWYK